MEFVNGNPLSFIDPDGHGKTDPSKQASTDWGFDHLKTLVQSMLKTYMYTIANAPRHAYIEAPRQLMKRFSWDENVRKRTREAGRGRLEESKLLYYNLSIVLGMDPERFLPAVVLPWIKPQTKPWALVDVPFYGKPLHNELRAKISSPVTQGGQLGSLLGNFTTVGTSLVLLRTLAMSALPPYMKFAFSPILIGQILGSLGRSEKPSACTPSTRKTRPSSGSGTAATASRSPACPRPWSTWTTRSRKPRALASAWHRAGHGLSRRPAAVPVHGTEDDGPGRGRLEGRRDHRRLALAELDAAMERELRRQRRILFVHGAGVIPPRRRR